MLRHIHADVQIFGVDLLLKGNEHLAHALGQLKADLLLLRNAPLVLQAGNVQHTADQTAQALGLLRDQ